MLENGTVVFAYLWVVTGGDVHGELFAVSDDGRQARLLDRRSLAPGDDRGPDGRRRYVDIVGNYTKIWDVVGKFTPATGQNSGALPDVFIDPTVTVVAKAEKLLIGAADNLGGIGMFEWKARRLSVLWHASHEFNQHSSPAIFSGTLMVFGQGDGKVVAYDVLTGVKMWQYDAGGPVLATPAGQIEKQIFVVAADHILALRVADGTLVHDGNTARKLPLKGPTYSSPAVTSNRLYVAGMEMVTLTHDFKTRGHDTNFHGNRLASPAVGRDGAVYAVAADGTIYKYAGTN